MFHLFVLFCLCWWRLNGVFTESVSVLEGDFLLLHTDAPIIRKDDDLLWKFGAEKSPIAEISGAAEIFSIYDDVLDGRFRNRLTLNNVTGSLTITNITTEHAGVYELKISGAKLTSKTIRVSVYAHLPVPVIIRDFSQCSSFCSLVCSVVNVSAVSLSWYKVNSLLSSISVSDLSISLSLPLEVEYQENNTYSCVINNTISNHTTHLNVSQLCQQCQDHGLLLWHTVIISATAGFLLIVAVIGIFCICKRKQKTNRANKKNATDSSLSKPKMKSKDAVYENVRKKR